MVTAGNYITASDISGIIAKINAEENTRSAGGSPYTDVSVVNAGDYITGVKFVEMINRNADINAEHCYCQGQGSIETHNGGAGIGITSSTADYDIGDSITAANINEIDADIDGLVAQCNCDSFACDCETYCNCFYNCGCNTVDSCPTNCTCDTRCVCYYNCTCDYNQQTTCGCNLFGCPEFECLVCTCNQRNICTCEAQCNCQTNCDCDTNCGCNRDCSCDYDCICDNQCTCQSNCGCNKDCTCDDRCTCEYGG